MNRNERIREIYRKLLRKYGRQGWWPLISRAGKQGFDSRGYHKGAYTFPADSSEIFEVCLGALLTQNTSWRNAEKALFNLRKEGLLTPAGIIKTDYESLSGIIKPAGYFNQKAKKIKIFSQFFSNLKDTPSREDLLSIWGVGKETADSILLYAFNQPISVVDAYTRRIAAAKGIIKGEEEYDKIRSIFEDAIGENLEVYQEYHALLVEHGKRFYSKKPYGEGDLIL